MSEAPWGQEGSEMIAFISQTFRRCRAKRSESEDIRRIAEADAERAIRRKAEAQRRAVERVRAQDGWFKNMVERAVDSYKKNRVEGLVEVRVIPGPRWTMLWWNDVCAHRVRGFVPEALPENVGTTAILFAVERMETRLREGRRLSDAAAYVYKEARAAMMGERTTWVSPSVAAQNPHLIVSNWRYSYAGRMWLLYEERIKRVYKDPEERRKRGLTPFPAND